MDSQKIIKHIYLGSASSHFLAQFFTHIYGVISVYKGNLSRSGKPFLHIAYDDLGISFVKLITTYISLSYGAKDADITIFLDGEDREDLEMIYKDVEERFKDLKLSEESLSEYSSHSEVPVLYEDLVMYVAKGDEIGQKSLTKEGLATELNNIKSAMLNLLEDSYESQDKIIMQSESLSKALAESKEFAATAEEERANYLLLLSSVGEGIIVLDSKGNINIANNAVLSLLNMGRDDIYGKKLYEALDIEDRRGDKISMEMINQILSTEEIIRLPPLFVKRKDGSKFTTSTVVSPVKNKQTNEHVGIILTFRDIGEELTLEEARINFISTASHQLRTPLTSMRWFAEMLYNGEAGPTTDEQHEYIEQITQGINRMVILVNYLLRTARVESNRTKIIPENTKIDNVLDFCIGRIDQDLKRKNQRITITGDDIPEIPLDKDYVNEVFLNVIKNANLYGKDNDEIIINKKMDGQFASISITDHGIGISEEDKPRVFMKFFRSENAVISSPDGTGLGLSFVKLLVNEWSGKITFTSEKGVGTTFTITIPLSGMKEREGDVRLNE